jgi:hypothetical protein
VLGIIVGYMIFVSYPDKKSWFLQRLPSGQSLDLPMSPQLETLIRAMAAKPE